MNTQSLADIVKSRRLDLDRLSQRSGVSSERITAIMQGADPTLAELRKLSTALHVRIMDLVPSDPDRPAAQWLFRTVASGHSRADPVVLSNLARKIEYSLKLLSPSPQEGALWWAERFKSGTTYADADENAGIFRNLFYGDDHVSPLLSLPRIVVEKLGVVLFGVDAAGMDGASAYFSGIPYIFVSNRFRPRMLFTLAHEVGHILSHHDAAQSFAVYDEEEPEDAELTTSHRTGESFAHAFASCLLMPSGGVGIALEKIRAVHKIREDSPLGDIEILLLSRIFGVSFVAAARRCEDLRLLPRGGARSLDDWLKKEYGSAEKRADSIGLPPRPEIEFPRIPERLLESAVAQIRAGKISVGKASAVLGMPISDLLSANRTTVH